MSNMMNFLMIANLDVVALTLRSTWKKCPASNQRQQVPSFFTPGLCCHRRLGAGFSEGRGRRSDGLHSVSRSLDNIVFPSVIPYRRFASDEATPLTNDPRWLY